MVRISRLRREEIHNRKVPLGQDGGKQLHGRWRLTRCFRRRTCETRRINNSCIKQARNTHATVLLYIAISTPFIHSFLFQFYPKNIRNISRRKIRTVRIFIQQQNTIVSRFFFFSHLPSRDTFFLSGKEGKFEIHELYQFRFLQVSNTC